MRDQRLLGFAKEMRREQTEPEIRLWHQLLAERFQGIKFRRQKVIGQYIVDFAARDPIVAIEIDGDSHGAQQKYDLRRTEFLKQQGYKVLRFTNSEVVENLDGVLMAIANSIQISPLPTLSPKGERAKGNKS